MNVQVIPTTHFVHNEYNGVKGVPLDMSLVQAQLLRDNGLVEDFDESKTFDDAEADKRAAEEKAQAEEAAKRAGPSVKMSDKLANKMAAPAKNK